MNTQRTVLFEEHIRLKALMAPFAGWEMPIHYGSIIDETKTTRSSCAVFDICHMGEFIITEASGVSFDRAVTNPVLKMKEKSCKYGFLLNENGTVIDDLIIYRIAPDKWMVVVNASNIERDAAEITKRLSEDATFEDISSKTVKIDIQGPKALEVMKSFAGDGIKALSYFGFDHFEILGERSIVSRTGYTGELGFEVYISNKTGVLLWQKLLEHPLVKPAGLGSRDILRLEAGLPLYGDELTEETTPLEAGMEKFIDFEKDFHGKASLLAQKSTGIQKKLVAIEIDGRRTPRHTNRVAVNGIDIGFVTSGVFSPHLGRGIGYAYVAPEYAVPGQALTIILERGEINAVVAQAPFVKNTSIRYRED